MLLSDVFDKIGDEVADPSHIIISKATLTDWVNEGVRRIARQTGEHELETTLAIVAGTESYALPTGTIGITKILNQHQMMLQRTEFESFQKMGFDPLELSAPIYWYEENEKVYFWPIPIESTTFPIFYTGLPNDMVTPTDDAVELPLEKQYHDTIVTFVRMRANERLGDLDSAVFARTEVEEELQKDRDQAFNPEKDQFPAIGMADPWEVVWD